MIYTLKLDAAYLPIPAIILWCGRADTEISSRLTFLIPTFRIYERFLRLTKAMKLKIGASLWHGRHCACPTERVPPAEKHARWG